MDEKNESQSSPSGSGANENLETAAGTSNGSQQKPSQQQEQQPDQKASKLKQYWQKLGLDFMTVAMMFKGSIGPTIAIAIYQSPAVAAEYTTLGYLVAIMSILGFPIMPRGKFIQTMSLNILSVCLGAAVNLLALYSATQARMHTAAPGAPPNAYNSSASAVCAIWLFFQVYLINYLRAARPQFQFPAIVYSIFVIVGMSYGPSFPTMTYAISFVERLLKAFLTGFGLATGVHFFIFPVSSRTVVFKEMEGYVKLLDGMLKAQTAYMQSLETIDPVAMHEKQVEESKNAKQKGKKEGESKGPLSTPASEKLKGVYLKLMELHTKLNGDITPAKREFAVGKLESKDIVKIWKHLRGIFVPILGVSSSIDIMQRRAEQRHWESTDLSPEEAEANREQIEALHATMKALHEPFAKMTESIGKGFQHILLTLDFTKPPKSKKEDEEKGEGTVVPGSAKFAEHFKSNIDDFYNSKQETLKGWCRKKGINLSDDFFEQRYDSDGRAAEGDEKIPDGLQRQLFFVLYMEHMLNRAGQAVLELVLAADKMKQDGRLKHNKFIFPGSKVLYKWLGAVFGQEDLQKSDEYLTDLEDGARQSIYLGQGFEKRKDPEHLPPRNAGEKIGEIIRMIPNFFRHPASAFGFRVACATMSIAIIDYLHDTQQFFLKQRLLWSMIMIAISMSRMAGQSTYNFALRVLGTAVAMVGAYIIWYIVDGHAPGVIVFLWLWMMCGFYIVLKFPKFIIIGILSVVTSVLIVGYELQVDVIGKQVAEQNGQPAYPTYLLAPYRLATVAGGLFVAWIWTIWPYPISETSELRKDLGASLYMLANFSSVVREIVQSRVKGIEGDVNTMGTHAYNLEKARLKVFSKLLLLLNDMRTNSAFSKFQLRVGGRFPREEYEGLIECVQRILNYQVLMAYASGTLSLGDTSAEEKSAWSHDFRRLVSSAHVTSNQITSILSLLSSSLTNGQPLPPHLELPQPFGFVRKLESIDRNILSVRHVVEPEYSAFAVIQICGGCIVADIHKLAGHVKTLVGEMDFSFHALNPSGTNSDASSLSSGDDAGKSKAE